MTIGDLLREIKILEAQATKQGVPQTDDEGHVTGHKKLSKALFLAMPVCINQVNFEDMMDIGFKNMHKQAKDEEGKFKFHPAPPNAPPNFRKRPVMEPITVVVVE